MADRDSSAPIKVGIYCWECKAVRSVDGRRLDFPTHPARCGYDYGEGFLSHLRVSPVYVLPSDQPLDSDGNRGDSGDLTH